MEKSEKGTKKFSKEEKVKILHEAKEKGVKKTLSKYGLYPATYYYWKRKYDVYGSEGLEHSKLKEREDRIKRLEKELQTVKLLLAEKEIEGKLKDELIKKKYQGAKKKGW